jgi:hypothetical protein
MFPNAPAARILPAAALTVLVAGAALIAGPLTPPAGPMAPTYKTLAEVQPRTPVQSLAGTSTALYLIDQPGSYYLTGNITNTPAGLSAIRVTADDVSIDLCGFAIDGGGTGVSAIDAAYTGITSLAVRNGSISNWPHAALDGTYVSACHFESIRVRNSGENAAIIAGNGSVVHACSTYAGQIGFDVGGGATISDCAAASPAWAGFFVGWGTTIARCSSFDAGNSGIVGIGEHCSILDCTVRGGSYGIYLDGSMHLVERCKIGGVGIGINAYFTDTILNNSISAGTAGQGTGIFSYEECRIDGNHIYGFDTGISSSTATVVTANVLTTCTHSLAGSGSAMVAPVVTTAAQLAANPTANIAQ